VIQTHAKDGNPQEWVPDKDMITGGIVAGRSTSGTSKAAGRLHVKINQDQLDVIVECESYEDGT
jgi:hypothetical protein